MTNREQATGAVSAMPDDDLAEIVAQAGGRADALRDARILVTGATGWFGAWLLAALVSLDRTCDLGLRIVAISRDPQRFAGRHASLANASNIQWVTGDVRDGGLGVEGRITHGIHAATDASAALNATAPQQMFDTIVEGTRNVLRIAADAGAKRVLMLSSGAVYGPQPASIAQIDEAYSGAPDALATSNAYAEGKRAAEQLAAIAHATRGIEPVIARCFAFVGPGMPFDTHFAIGNFIRDALERDVIVIRGDGLPKRSYLYMTDLVAWLVTLLVAAPPLRAFNVGSSEAISVGALAMRCASLAQTIHGRRVDVRVEGSIAGGPSYVPCTQRSERELGLRTRVGLDEAIMRTMKWRVADVAGRSTPFRGGIHRHG